MLHKICDAPLRGEYGTRSRARPGRLIDAGTHPLFVPLGWGAVSTISAIFLQPRKAGTAALRERVAC